MESFLNNIPFFYWINLNRSKERYNNMKKLFETYNIRNMRIEGFDGKNNEFPEGFKSNRRNKKVEVSITLSHFRAIHEFLKSDQELCIIAEDDLSFDYLPYWNKPFEDFMKELPEDWEIFQLSLVIMTHRGLLRHLKLDKDIIKRKRKHFSATAYVINRKGGLKLMSLYCNEYNNLKFSNNIDRYIDLSKPITNDNKIERSDSENIIFGSLNTYCLKIPLFTYNESEINNSVHQNDQRNIFSFCKETFLNEWKNKSNTNS